MSLEVIEAAGLVTVQDAGRLGWRRFGVPVSGPMDWFAFEAANALVCNPPGSAAIEVGVGDVVLRANGECVVAAAGAGYEVSTYIWTFPLWTAFVVRGGWKIRLTRTGGGNWAYLAVAGAFEVEPVLGSSSTYQRGGLGQPLQPGDTLKTGRPGRSLHEISTRALPDEKRAAYKRPPIIDVVPGPQQERFEPGVMQAFFENEYVLSATFDRMGYRLEGPALSLRGGADLLSEGMAAGSVQVPANGQPIVMMADGPTTGGYPKIGCVARADLPALAQCEPGIDKIRFRETTVQAAQQRYRALVQDLHAGIISSDDELSGDA